MTLNFVYMSDSGLVEIVGNEKFTQNVEDLSFQEDQAEHEMAKSSFGDDLG